MATVKAIFDGKTILIPPEMKNAIPGEVTITFNSPAANDEKRPSLWDVIGKCKNPMTGEEIDAYLEEERNSWGDD